MTTEDAFSSAPAPETMDLQQERTGQTSFLLHGHVEGWNMMKSNFAGTGAGEWCVPNDHDH